MGISTMPIHTYFNFNASLRIQISAKRDSASERNAQSNQSPHIQMQNKTIAQRIQRNDESGPVSATLLPLNSRHQNLLSGISPDKTSGLAYTVISHAVNFKWSNLSFILRRAIYYPFCCCPWNSHGHTLESAPQRRLLSSFRICSFHKRPAQCSGLNSDSNS